MSANSHARRLPLTSYEESLERQFSEAGLLPHLTRLRRQSGRFFLDHGPAQRTGLAGEHLSTGLSPADADRWSAVAFDPATYAVWQEGTRQAPFARLLTVPTVVFDATYFDLDRAPSVRGIVNWGAHDPGVPAGARPGSLLDELTQRIGAYPAQPWIYGITWASVQGSRSGWARTLARGLAEAAGTRGGAGCLASACPTGSSRW